ncbi:MAG TPA: sodium-dependent transporter [Myxococcota bacterium]|nr:sodium-dependent transporter [Myxococcota bacterium]
MNAKEQGECGDASRGQFNSRLGFVLAAAGSAVGLGNLWRFPYLTYKYGGAGADAGGAGTFVIVYLACIALVCLPLILAEILVGKRGRRNPVGSFNAIRPGTRWNIVGYLGIATGFLILSYYAVVAGWSIEYTYKSLVNEFAGFETAIPDEEAGQALAAEFISSHPGTDDAVALESARTAAGSPEAFNTRLLAKKAELHPQHLFSQFVANPVKQVGYFLAFMLLTVILVLGGVAGGIERGNKVMMPLLLLMLIVLAIRVLTLEGGGRIIGYLFKPSLSTLSWDLVLAAMGQAFFSLSVGMGALLTYGSYLGPKDRIETASAAIPAIDASVALLASIVVCGAIISFGLAMSGSGTGNVFTAIPVIFQSIPGGRWLVVLFYLLVTLAALTSTISLLEVVASYMIDERKMKRTRAVLLSAAAISAVGVICALSFNLLSGYTLFGMTFFDMLDYICSNIALPVGGILIAIFVGWVMRHEEKREELVCMNPIIYRVWNVLLKFLAPAAILAVLIGQFVFRS